MNKAESHRFRDDHIHLLRNGDLLDLTEDHLNDFVESVGFHEAARVAHHSAAFHCIHLLGSRLGRKQRENTASGSHIQHNLSLEIGYIVRHGIVVGSSAGRILQHVLLMGQLAIESVEGVLLLCNGNFSFLHFGFLSHPKAALFPESSVSRFSLRITSFLAMNTQYYESLVNQYLDQVLHCAG